MWKGLNEDVYTGELLQAFADLTESVTEFIVP